MKRILPHLLDSIKTKAIKIDAESGFMDKSWTFIDSHNRKIQYLFKTNNRLLAQSGGTIVEGQWEFIPQWNGIIIKIDNQTNFYKQALVFDDAIMILNIGDSLDYLLLSNDKKLLPENIESYIQEALRKEPPLPGGGGGGGEDLNFDILIVFLILVGCMISFILYSILANTFKLI
jgi:hypothetical protein